MMENLTNPIQAQVNALKTNNNDFFLVTMGVIVYFMQCGFAFLEAGSVRAKNVTNIIAKNIVDSFVGGISYWIFGFAFAFGPGNAFIGYKYFALADLPGDKFSFWFFQFVFAATATTIVSGALAERCEFVAYLTYSIVITGFVYPVVSHWTWADDGWLKIGITASDMSSSFQDFAGSSVVHCTGGIAALIGAIFLGPRLGRFNEDGSANDLKGHSVPLASLGGFILFFGFFAFNGGSQTSISEPGDGTAVSKAIVNTTISASFAAVLLLFANRIILHKTWNIITTINGALTGMVAICAGCNVVPTWGAAVIGIVAGLSYLFWSWAIIKLKIDDPLDAVAVHFGGGSWGVISVALFNANRGILLKWNLQSGLDLGCQLLGFFVICLWVTAVSALLFGALRYFKIFRVSEEFEVKGLDIPKHGEPAYPLLSYGHGWREEDLKGRKAVGSNLTRPRIPSIASHTRLGQEESNVRSSNTHIEMEDIEISNGVNGPYTEGSQEGIDHEKGEPSGDQGLHFEIVVDNDDK